MPRIFTVTFTKEFTTTIVAESQKELEKALRSYPSRDIDDWSDEEWDWSVLDPYMLIKTSEMMPKKFEEPDMGILDGEPVNIHDYAKEFPNYLDEVAEEANQLARKMDDRQQKLF